MRSRESTSGTGGAPGLRTGATMHRAPRLRKALALIAVLLAPAAGAAEAPSATVVAAGDIADCRPLWLRQLGQGLGLGSVAVPPVMATARLVERLPGTVLALGDLAYGRGTAEEFQTCYEPSWGRFKHRTRPVPGNHDMLTRDGAPYFAYWGEAAGPSRRGYYSFELGAWHVVALNSEAPRGPESPQARWLADDLARNDARCVLAFAHRPAFSSGKHGGDKGMRYLFRILHQHGVSLLLAGHDHNYERTAPLGPRGHAAPGRGLRQFVVGTGGTHLRAVDDRAPWSEAVVTGRWGVLRLDLSAARYAWRFLPADGGPALDRGEAACVDRAAVLSRSSE